MQELLDKLRNILKRIDSGEPELMLIIDSDGVIIDIAGDWEEVLGYHSHDLIGIDYTVFLTRQLDIQSTEDLHESTRNSGDPQQGNFINYWRAKSGEEVCIEWVWWVPCKEGYNFAIAHPLPSNHSYPISPKG